MLTALYRHMIELPHATDRSVTKEIVGDYVSYAPKVAAEAPAAIRPTAGTYLSAVSGYLAALAGAGFNLGKLPAGSLGALTEPAVVSAAKELFAYARSTCRYSIGG